MQVSKAIFAAGCFWGIQSVFESVPGVMSTIVGYTGGRVPNPTYMEVSSQRTGHAEAVEVMFDPEKVSYERLLDIFFANHDPTTPNRQGPDIGTQYRSAVFYTDENQKQAALKKISALNSSGAYSKPIVTEIAAAATFYPAEEYHQHYLYKRGQTSCGLHR